MPNLGKKQFNRLKIIGGNNNHGQKWTAESYNQAVQQVSRVNEKIKKQRSAARLNNIKQTAIFYIGLLIAGIPLVLMLSTLVLYPVFPVLPIMVGAIHKFLVVSLALSAPTAGGLIFYGIIFGSLACMIFGTILFAPRTESKYYQILPEYQYVKEYNDGDKIYLKDIKLDDSQYSKLVDYLQQYVFNDIHNVNIRTIYLNLLVSYFSNTENFQAFKKSFKFTASSLEDYIKEYNMFDSLVEYFNTNNPKQSLEDINRQYLRAIEVYKLAKNNNISYTYNIFGNTIYSINRLSLPSYIAHDQDLPTDVSSIMKYKLEKHRDPKDNRNISGSVKGIFGYRQDGFIEKLTRSLVKQTNDMYKL